MGTRGGWECRATLGRHLLSFSLLSHKSEGQLYLKNLILSITTCLLRLCLNLSLYQSYEQRNQSFNQINVSM